MENQNREIIFDRPLPKPGETFEAKGRRWVALGMEQEGLLAVSAEPICRKCFDNGQSNDWRKSSLRSYLNGEFLDGIGKDGLLPFISDLTADNGETDYGTSEDRVFLLSCDLYRKYRKLIPRYDDWTWTLTPWVCVSPYPSFCRYVRGVIPSTGALYSNNANLAGGVVAGLLFNPASFAVEG